MADPVQEYKPFIDGLLGWPRASALAGLGVTLERARGVVRDWQDK